MTNKTVFALCVVVIHYNLNFIFQTWLLLIFLFYPAMTQSHFYSDEFRISKNPQF